MRALIVQELPVEYHILTADNGKTALSLLETLELPPDIILSDVMMPEMDGYEFTRAIRQKPEYEGIPILLITAKTDPVDRVTGIESGAIDYIVKPFNVRELLARVSAQLEMKQYRDRLKNAHDRLLEKLQNQVRRNMPDFTDGDSEEKVRQVKAFIDEHYEECDLGRAKIADALKMSERYLSTTFNTITGKKIPDYIRHLRVKKAKELLKDPEVCVINIVGQSGFNSLRQLNRAFKLETGLAPSEYQKKTSPGQEV
jgi:YesN/AraC family two-component response regulator